MGPSCLVSGAHSKNEVHFAAIDAILGSGNGLSKLHEISSSKKIGYDTRVKALNYLTSFGRKSTLDVLVRILVTSFKVFDGKTKDRFEVGRDKWELIEKNNNKERPIIEAATSTYLRLANKIEDNHNSLKKFLNLTLSKDRSASEKYEVSYVSQSRGEDAYGKPTNNLLADALYDALQSQKTGEKSYLEESLKELIEWPKYKQYIYKSFTETFTGSSLFDKWHEHLLQSKLSSADELRLALNLIVRSDKRSLREIALSTHNLSTLYRSARFSGRTVGTGKDSTILTYPEIIKIWTKWRRKGLTGKEKDNFSYFLTGDRGYLSNKIYLWQGEAFKQNEDKFVKYLIYEVKTKQMSKVEASYLAKEFFRNSEEGNIPFWIVNGYHAMEGEANNLVRSRQDSLMGILDTDTKSNTFGQNGKALVESHWEAYLYAFESYGKNMNKHGRSAYVKPSKNDLVAMKLWEDALLEQAFSIEQIKALADTSFVTGP
ncbi:MAG: hypothetical protein HOO06_10125 [Bdellovibrionaceae bacterium]|jgi:hypothetical protein|nr:hypothetical protein [Pseudobdellovibrionaceae bacterium]